MSTGRATELMNAISQARIDLANTEHELDEFRRRCPHEWSEKFDPKIEKGYTIPRREGQGSHPPEPAMDVPEKRTDRWKRECKLCGKEEFTEKFTEKKEKVPIWSYPVAS